MEVTLPNMTTSTIAIPAKFQTQIDKAMAEFQRGETLHFDSADKMKAWLDSL